VNYQLIFFIETISFSPPSVPENTLFSLQLINFPLFHLTSKNVSVKLISNDSTIDLACDSFSKTCNSTNSLNTKKGTYECFVIVDNDISNLISSKFTVNPMPSFATVKPSVFFATMKTPISISGSKFTKNSNTFVLVQEINNVFATTKYESTAVPTVVNENEMTVAMPTIPVNVSKASISVSFNGGASYHFIKSFDVFATPQIEFVKNQDSVLKGSSGFSFRSSRLEISGNNFYSPPSGPNVKFRVRNELKSKVWDSNYTFSSQKLIEFQLPSIEDLKIQAALSFPIAFQFGVSFNDGYDFIEQELLYLDKYTSLYLFQVIPTIIPKIEKSLSIQGVGFDYVNRCQVRIGETVLFERPITKTELSNVVACNITSEFSNVNTITVHVLNIFNDISNGFNVTIYGKSFFY
jgi:hypothetical protein